MFVACLNQDALLIRPKNEALMQSICERKRVSMVVIGKIKSTYYAPSMFEF
jgi:phosphoribosylformylglycinamidine (FGAM) synthase-like enzyme